MKNQPFLATNIDFFDEKTHNTTPGNLNGQNVLVTQDQHRKIFNTLTTSIAGVPGYQPPFQMDSNNPNSVTFTFNSSNNNNNNNRPCYCQQPQNFNSNNNNDNNRPCYCQPQNFPWQCGTPAMNLNDLDNRNAINLMRLQQQLNPQPYQLKFHADNQTSTTDIGAKLNGRADLQNLAALLMSKWPYWLQSTPCYDNHKKLILKKKTEKLNGDIIEAINKKPDNPDDPDDQKKGIKKVTFNLKPTVSDVETQVNFPCNYCQPGTSIGPPPPPPLQNRRRSSSPQRRNSVRDDDNSTSDTDDSTNDN